MSNPPGLLILCGGIEAVPGIEAAKRLGFNTVVVDGSVAAPGRAIAHHFVQASIYHPQQVIHALSAIWNDIHIDGVVTLAADNSLTVAHVGAHFGLKSQSVRTATLGTNKMAMKESMRAAGIPIPWFLPIGSIVQLQDLLAARPGRYVLKPIDSRGSRGVIRLSSVTDCRAAFEYARRYTKLDLLLLEEWLDGPQLSSESLVWRGRSYLSGLADRNYGRLSEMYPHVVEDGGETPSRHYDLNMEVRINELMDCICQAFGLVDGSIKGDLVLVEDELYVIEVATRLSGGSFSTVTIPLVYGYDFIGNVFKMAIGLTPQLPSRPLVPRCFQANRFLFPPAGKVLNVYSEATPDPRIIDSWINVKIGDMLDSITDHTQRAGWVLASGSSRSDAIDAAEAFIRSTRIEVEKH